MTTTARRVCKQDGCEGVHFANGDCQKHYRRQKRTGSPLYKPGAQSVSKRPTPRPGTRQQDPLKGSAKVQVRGMFVQGNTALSQPSSVKVEGDALICGDRIQLAGIVCPDCRGETIATVGGYPIRSKPQRGWCPSESHPVFDSAGRLS